MMATGDVDRDGNADVVACLSNTGRVSVMRGNGAGGFFPAVTFPCGPFSLAIDLGDIDGDGDLDIMSSSYSAGTFSVFRNLGNGTYGPEVVLQAQGAGSCVIFADLDGDEDMEVIGIDELADLLFFFDSPPLPHQEASIGASMEINGVGGAPGFGGAPALPVALGSNMTVDVAGHPGQPWLLPMGIGMDPGAPGPAGVLGLQPNIVFVVNGLIDPTFTLDANGEGSLTVPVPPWLPLGLPITLQGLAVNPANLAIGFTFANPMTIVFN